MRVKDAVGRFGEELAASRLAEVGLQIVDRNWRCRHGELDIVAMESSTVVFVEVKTRSGEGFGDPAEAISAAKAMRIRRLAARWLAEHPDLRRQAIRFDVVAVIRRASGEPTVRHVRAAF